jgi:hypothetical protein
MRKLFGIFTTAFLLLSPADAQSPLAGPQFYPSMQPAADETPVDTPGSDETDALLDCYAKFRGPAPYQFDVGPPRITHSPEAGYVLRADYNRDSKESLEKGSVDRLICWKGGARAQRYQTIPPLYLPQSLSPDVATARVMEGWAERRNREEALNKVRFATPDGATIHYLEGIWLVGEKPDKGSCLANSYDYKTQIEFEFHKTGGRALIFEPPDLFTAIAISGIDKKDNVLSIQGLSRDGVRKAVMRVRILPDHLEFLSVHDPVSSTTTPAAVDSAYRCGDPDPSVNAAVSFEKLATMVPPVSGGYAIMKAIPGVPDTDLCQGKVGPEFRQQGQKQPWLQLELYGPVHYWILGFNFPSNDRHVFDYVRTVKDAGDHTLKLEMQEHLEKGDGWDVPESRGKLYELTLIDHGGRIEIPELATTFVKCKPTDPASLGVHRW